MPPQIERLLYRVGQEAISNAVKHSGVVENESVSVEVWLERSKDRVSLVVQDNGQGFDIESTLSLPGKWGLRRMRDNVTEMGGLLEILSVPSGGTIVRATIRLEGELSDE